MQNFCLIFVIESDPVAPNESALLKLLYGN